MVTWLKRAGVLFGILLIVAGLFWIESREFIVVSGRTRGIVAARAAIRWHKADWRVCGPTYTGSPGGCKSALHRLAREADLPPLTEPGRVYGCAPANLRHMCQREVK
jgi:hypothetical protein